MDQKLEEYLEKVEKYLKPLPVSERVDIVQEIKSGMTEQSNSGRSPEEILGRLGDARELARAYLSQVITGEGDRKGPARLGLWSGWRRICALAAFYSLAGLGGMFLLPFTSVLGLSLMFCGLVAPVAGAVKFAGELAGFQIPGVMLEIELAGFHYQAEGIWMLLYSILMGVVLFLAGKLLWALTLKLVRIFGRAKQKMG